jgi:hypothetical protein
VLAGYEREALVGVADRLSRELGYREDEEPPAAQSRLTAERWAAAGLLDSEDEALVARLRRGLAKVAAAIDGGGAEGASENAVTAALDGAELVIRGELLSGNAAQLAALLPGFVFLVALTMVNQDRALELSRRTGELLEGALGG